MSARTPTFSIVMPAFNAEATIGPAVRSALAQTREDFELIVVDDGSTDATLEVVRPLAADPRLVLVESENGGPAAARNIALARIRGRYVSLLDSDDLYLPTYLAEMESVLARDPDLGFAFPDAWVIDGSTGRLSRVSRLANYAPPDPRAADWLRQLVAYNVVHYMAMIPREVLARVGPFDERLRAAMDYELWLRIAASGYRAVRVPERLGVYRVMPGSITSQRRLVTENLGRLYRFVADEYDVDPDVRALAREQLGRAQLSHAAESGGTSRAARLERLRRAVRRPPGALRRRMRSRRLWYDSPPDDLRAFLTEMRVL